MLGQLPDHFVDNDPVAVNKDRLRDASHSIINGCGTICIDDVRVGDPIVLYKAETIALCILKIDTEKDDPLALYTPPCGLQERRFMFTGIAPRRPEVEQYEFSFEVAR